MKNSVLFDTIAKSPTGIFEEHAVFRNGVCIGQVPASDTADTCGWEKQKERHQNPGSGVVKGMKRLGKVALAVWFCIVFLAGCGEAKVPDVVTVPTVAVSKRERSGYGRWENSTSHTIIWRSLAIWLLRRRRTIILPQGKKR